MVKAKYPLLLCEPSAKRKPSASAWYLFQPWVYRIGGLVVLNVLDDPAWLTLMFC